jgi:YbbR domain-containing protein
MRNSSLVRFTLSNLGWMAASIFLAMVVWIAATMSNNPIEEKQLRRVPVDIPLPDGYVITSPLSQIMATVVVRTQQSEWDLLGADDVLITADTEAIRKPGEYRLELTGKIISPRHGKIIAIDPSTITFAIAQEVEKRVPVRVVVSKEPPLGYTYPAELICDQTEVTVRGSQESVDAVVAAEVRLSLSDDLNPVVKTGQPLIPVRQNGREVTGNIVLEPNTVDCPVEIRARDDVIQMRVLPNVIGVPPSGYLFAGYAEVNPETVGVTGSRAAINAMNYVVRTEPIDLSARTETFTIEIPVDLPDGVELVPANQLISVTVTISASTSSLQYEDVTVEIVGLDTTLYRVTGVPSAATVIVVGPQDHLPERDKLRVIVDLTGLQPGNHQVRPEGMIVGEDSVGMMISVLPEELSVTIEALSPSPTPAIGGSPDATEPAPSS